MFNYVVKDPDSSRLSGEFWIKDSDRLGHIRVSSNLVALRLFGIGLPEIVTQGLYPTRFNLAQRHTTFSTNFSRLSKPEAVVNSLFALYHFDAGSPYRQAEEASEKLIRANLETS
jgi:hypothetical protein